MATDRLILYIYKLSKVCLSLHDLTNVISIFLKMCHLLENVKKNEIVFCNRCISKAMKASTSLLEQDLELDSYCTLMQGFVRTEQTFQDFLLANGKKAHIIPLLS